MTSWSGLGLIHSFDFGNLTFEGVDDGLHGVVEAR